MALSIVAPVTKGRSNDAVGARRVTYLRVNLGTLYATGGLPFDPKAFGHQGAVDRVIIQPRWAGTGATGTMTRRFEYDYSAKKIVAIVTSTGAEVGAVDVSLCTLDIEVYSD